MMEDQEGMAAEEAVKSAEIREIGRRPEGDSGG